MTFRRFVNGFQVLVAMVALATVALLLTLDPEPPAAATVDEALGPSVFAANCAGCHSDDRSGGVGPSLVGEGALARFDGIEAVAAFVRSGSPGRMPGFETRLTPDEIAAVAGFVWNGREDR